MVKNHNLAKAISDAGWGMFCTMLKYKAEFDGKTYLEPTFRTLNCHIRFLTPIFIHFYAGETTELRKNSISHKVSA